MRNKREQAKVTARELPRHIAVIMDGNGRWAKKRGLPRSAGHSAGAKVFRQICRYANQIGLSYMTFYAFSTENWKRPKEEVDALMDLLRDYLKDASNFRDENIVCRFIGERSRLPEDLQQLMRDAEEGSKDATGLTVNIALNYGGRDEIVTAARKLLHDVNAGELSLEDVDEGALSSRLYTAGQPDPDLIIRPSGEYRLSNFLIWQSAYAEYWFSDILWPDFKPKHLEQAISDYSKRDRRFGGV